MKGPLTCITLHQPWASLIVAGLKQYETRSWPTRHRGLLGIHAGKQLDKEAMQAYRDIFHDHAALLPDPLPLGALVGTARMTACKQCDPRWTDALLELERRVGNFRPGRYAWRLEDRTALEQPIPLRGHQGLWLAPQVNGRIVGDR